MSRLGALIVRAGTRGRVSIDPSARTGRKVRFDVAPGARVTIGAGCVIGDRSRIEAGPGGIVRIGPRTRLGEGCIVAAHELVEIGADVRAGDDVVLHDGARTFDDVELPIREQGFSHRPVRVGDGATLGARAFVAAGATIGARAVVEAGSMVDAVVPAERIVVGVPARDPSAQRPEPAARRRRGGGPRGVS